MSQSRCFCFPSTSFGQCRFALASLKYEPVAVMNIILSDAYLAKSTVKTPNHACDYPRYGKCEFCRQFSTSEQYFLVESSRKVGGGGRGAGVGRGRGKREGGRRI